MVKHRGNNYNVHLNIFLSSRHYLNFNLKSSLFEKGKCIQNLIQTAGVYQTMFCCLPRRKWAFWKEYNFDIRCIHTWNFNNFFLAVKIRHSNFVDSPGVSNPIKSQATFRINATHTLDNLRLMKTKQWKTSLRKLYL